MAGELTIHPENLIRPKQKRMTDRDKAFAMRAARDGWRQIDIAQRIGVSQSAVSLWLKECDDTRREAREFLDGQALTIAQKAVKKGTATDLIKLLASQSVIGDTESGPSIVINIGCQTTDIAVVMNSESESVKDMTVSVTGTGEPR